MEDRSWMYRRYVPGVVGITSEFKLGVEEFMKFALRHRESSTFVRCPCAKCKNKKYRDPKEVEAHLWRFGFIPNYYTWTSHGEFKRLCTSDDVHDPNTLEEFAKEAPNATAQEFYDRLRATDSPIWDGCTSHSQSSTLSRLLKLKSENDFSEKVFNKLIQLIKEVMPSDNKMPDNFCQIKKLVSGLGLSVKKIDVCTNGCMLYWKDDSVLRKCKFCGHARYMRRKYVNKKQYKEVSYKKMYYFPLTPRLQRLFASNKTAEHMRWHGESKSKDDKMNHPCDAEAWKDFNLCHREFAKDVRNVRLGLCTHEFAPFGLSKKKYRCWPIILTPYNLPPWLCMKDPFMFLTVIIPGPKSPKQKIDVYLQPLVDELNDLWTLGAHTYDISKKQNFQMRAALLWTMNDFSSYGMLSGWSTVGKLGCPYCMERTQSFYLPFEGKYSWFDCHRCFLAHDHHYRRDTKSFRKDKEYEGTSSRGHESGDLMWNRVCHFPKIVQVCGELKRKDGRGVSHNWAKKSIFWDLPYWKTLKIRHSIDVIHNEKNVFENIINTVLDVKGKTKDNIKSRRDMEEFCNRPELQLIRLQNGKIFVPKACYTLNKEQKMILLEWLKELKLPNDYALNLRKCVDLKELKLSGMKSHDCHVFMERLLPTTLKEFLPLNVWSVLAELSLFYRNLCASRLSVEHMAKLEVEIPIILCKLEKVFPPSFFDVMEHLIVHLPYEAKVGGPVQYRSMYPFERYMSKLKINVTNKAIVEGSICNEYLVEEALNFFSYYFESHVQTKDSIMIRNDEGVPQLSERGQVLSICNISGQAIGKVQKIFISYNEYKAAMTCILLNCKELQPFLEKFKMVLQAEVPNITKLELQIKIENEFFNWFRNYVHHKDNIQGIPKYIRNLSWGIAREVKTFSGYIVNGYKFHTCDRAKERKSNNSGVVVRASGDDVGRDYYGVLREVIEAQIPGNPSHNVVFFKCDWFDQKIHPRYKLVDINYKRNYLKCNQFVLAQQTIQVYYLSYFGYMRSRRNWWSVCKIKPRHVDAQEDKVYQEDVEDTNIMNVDAMEDFTGSLMDAHNLHKVVDDEVKVRFEDSNLGGNDVEEVELETDANDEDEEEEEFESETDYDTDDSEEYISDEECSE